MSEGGTTDTQPSVAPDATDVLPECGCPEQPEPSRWSWPKRILIGLGLTVLVLVSAAGMLYGFGGMSGSVNDPQIGEAYEQLVTSGAVQPVEKRFVIPIPGCTCHSDDPYLTEQHRNRRMSQCMGCHGGR